MVLRCAAVFLFFVAVAAASPVPAGAAAGVKVVPHRALYSMSLGSTSQRSGVVGVEGLLAFEWADSCDGWTVDQRYQLRLHYSEGREIEIVTNYVSWEAKDGLNYRFNVRRLQNGQTDQEFRGKAALDGKGLAGAATYSKPADRVEKLPKRTLFPAEHTEALIERAVAGERLLSRHVFDGTTEDGTMLINAFIGAPLDVAQEADDPLVNQPGWQIRLAFFPLDQETSKPEYEVGIELQENGIARALELDYGDFSIKGALQRVEGLPKPDC